MVAIPGYEHVSSRLHGLKPARRPGTWKALCPAHDDRSPSLSLWVGRGGQLLANCWACGRHSFARIAGALGLPLAAFFADFDERQPRRRSRSGPMPKIVATYDYVSADGEVLYQKVRYEPKDFRVRRPDPAGDNRWLYGLADDTPRVLYRLLDLLEIGQEWVWITEGEKDTDALWSIGLPATTNHDGGGNWHDSYSQLLRRWNVAIVPDNDPAGKRHAIAVAGSLVYHGAPAVKIVHLAGLPEHGDVFDWLADFPRGVRADLKRRALLSELAAAPSWQRQKGENDGEGQGLSIRIDTTGGISGAEATAGQVRGDAADRPAAEVVA